MLIPNTSISPDSAFYTNDQYATLDEGRTRVRINVKTLPDGSVDAYGFYTGGKTDWENVPVIKAEKDGENYVADIGNGIGLTWTPALSPDGVLGIPVLEGVPQLPPVWVYPPTAKSDTLLANPAHPPEFQDAIIWFPDSGIEPVYIVLSTQLQKNKQRGKEYEDESFEEYSKTRPEAAREVTVKADNGVKTRVDIIGRDADGEISCVECKSSETAPLTKNQKSAFPEIEKTGGTVVGKGKPGFPGGTRIPPTRIDIIRPNQPSEGADMSITETKVVDIIAVPEWEPENVILVITDHLEWGDKAQQGEHLLLLQEKINSYVAFIESGELLESYPPAKDKLPIIRVNGLYELPAQGKTFVDQVTDLLKGAGIGFEFVLKESDKIRNM